MPAWFILATVAIGNSLRQNRIIMVIMLTLAAFSFGIWRGGSYFDMLKPYHEFATQTVTLQATASVDAIYGVNSQLTFEATDIDFYSPRAVHVPGTIKVSGFGELAVYKGDRLQITGKLYPTRGGKQATMGFAQFQRVGQHQTLVDTLRRKFSAGVQTALPEPAASFGLGLLIGQRNTLPYDTSQALLMVGLTHIVAVSGYNLTILIDVARRSFARYSKRITVITAFGLISVFLLFTGSSASIVRAAVVSTLGLLAWYYGRRVRPLVLILLAAAGTAYARPIYVWSDIGWYLSFLAFFGILVLAPQIFRHLYGEHQPNFMIQIAVETLCAEIMTIPLIMFIFGQVSLVGLLANMLVAVCIPLAMLLSFISGLAGMFVPLYAGWVAWPAKYLLTYMLDTATLLSRIPHSFKSNVYLSAADLVLCYAVIVGIVWILYKPTKSWFDKLSA
jgi:competence protein ComEC